MPVINDPYRRTLTNIASFISHICQLLFSPSTLALKQIYSLDEHLEDRHSSLMTDISAVSVGNITVPGTLTKDYFVLYSANSQSSTPLCLFSISYTPSALVYSDAAIGKSERSLWIQSYTKLNALLRSFPFLFNTLPISSLCDKPSRFSISSNFPTKDNVVEQLKLNPSDISFPSPLDFRFVVNTLCGTLTLQIACSETLPHVVSTPLTVVVQSNYLSPVAGLDTSVPPRRASLTPGSCRSRPPLSPTTPGSRSRSNSTTSNSGQPVVRFEPPPLLPDVYVRVFPKVEGGFVSQTPRLDKLSMFWKHQPVLNPQFFCLDASSSTLSTVVTNSTVSSEVFDSTVNSVDIGLVLEKLGEIFQVADDLGLQLPELSFEQLDRVFSQH
ncbi:hypothetical protein RCL1_008972 [Eukaryota sp. TZLM3-RCL]